MKGALPWIAVALSRAVIDIRLFVWVIGVERHYLLPAMNRRPQFLVSVFWVVLFAGEISAAVASKPRP
jgi:hypothetical protein